MKSGGLSVTEAVAAGEAPWSMTQMGNLIINAVVRQRARGAPAQDVNGHHVRRFGGGETHHAMAVTFWMPSAGASGVFR